MDIKKLKTSEVLDQLKGVEDDGLFDALLDEIHDRIPFADTGERFEELEKRNEG